MMRPRDGVLNYTYREQEWPVSPRKYSGFTALIFSGCVPVCHQSYGKGRAFSEYGGL